MDHPGHRPLPYVRPLRVTALSRLGRLTLVELRLLFLLCIHHSYRGQVPLLQALSQRKGQTGTRLYRHDQDGCDAVRWRKDDGADGWGDVGCTSVQGDRVCPDYFCSPLVPRLKKIMPACPTTTLICRFFFFFLTMLHMCRSFMKKLPQRSLNSWTLSYFNACHLTLYYCTDIASPLLFSSRLPTPVECVASSLSLQIFLCSFALSFIFTQARRYHNVVVMKEELFVPALFPDTHCLG